MAFGIVGIFLCGMYGMCGIVLMLVCLVLLVCLLVVGMSGIVGAFVLFCVWYGWHFCFCVCSSVYLAFYFVVVGIVGRLVLGVLLSGNVVLCVCCGIVCSFVFHAYSSGGISGCVGMVVLCVGVSGNVGTVVFCCLVLFAVCFGLIVCCWYCSFVVWCC